MLYFWTPENVETRRDKSLKNEIEVKPINEQKRI